MKRLAIIGSGDLGEQIAWHAFRDGHYQIAGFYDDMAPVGLQKHGFDILGATADIESHFNKGVFDELMIGIGYKHFARRKELFDAFQGKLPFGRIVHSSAFVDPGAIIGEGVFIYPGCVIDMKSRIEDNALLNAGCIIAHDSVIGSNSFLSPAVKVAGFVKVGSCVNLGIGTVVIDNIHIADYVRTGGGAVVTKNLEQPGLYVGIPAAFKKA